MGYAIDELRLRRRIFQFGSEGFVRYVVCKAYGLSLQLGTNVPAFPLDLPAGFGKDAGRLGRRFGLRLGDDPLTGNPSFGKDVHPFVQRLPFDLRTLFAATLDLLSCGGSSIERCGDRRAAFFDSM